uniref:Uncharacterized protein n=1 Tax=Oryza barthii TaxID=65489 RepID=A0A0D3ERU2_9ORYZ
MAPPSSDLRLVGAPVPSTTCEEPSEVTTSVEVELRLQCVQATDTSANLVLVVSRRCSSLPTSLSSATTHGEEDGSGNGATNGEKNKGGKATRSGDTSALRCGGLKWHGRAHV